MRYILSIIGFSAINEGSGSSAQTSQNNCNRIPEGEYRFALSEDKYLSIDVGQSPSTMWIDFTRDPSPYDEDSGLGSDHDEYYDLMPQHIRKRVDFRLDSDCTILVDNQSAPSFIQALHAISPLVGEVISSESLMAKYDSEKSAIVLGGWMELQRVVENASSYTMVPEPVEEGHYVHISSSGMVCLIRVINRSSLLLSVLPNSIRETEVEERDVRVFADYELLPHNKVLVKVGAQSNLRDFNFVQSMFNTLGGISSSRLIMRYNPEKKSLSVGGAVFDLDSAKVGRPAAENTSNQV